jgi:hypothetical protein
MLCQNYKDALIEAAASGSEPQGDLSSHLAGCADCRAGFEQEQALFASIGAGLQVVANSDVPASLLPRVRARLGEAGGLQRRWFHPWVFATASVALALAIFLSARPHRTIPDSQANEAPQSLVSHTSLTKAGNQNSSASAQVTSSAVNKSQTRVHPTLLRPVASSQPEVLVPPDEREAFARFVAVLGERREVALALVTPAPQTKDESTGLEPLQINGLEIKPLVGTDSEQSDGAEQKQ